MSRLRWALACGVGALGLASAIGSVSAYASRGLTLGAWSVGTLIVVLLAGMSSLAWARRRVGIELVSLQKEPPGGELFDTRRRRLEALQKAGARPDQDVLADQSEADEAGRAYIGRFLVATTVLIGLLGTFAGLIETLGRIAPLLSEKESAALSLLAQPLGGLHVTFGASLVAILVTLALALAQGDLVLAERRMLALLEDRTWHELVPALWPPSEDAAERAARRLDALETALPAAVRDGLAAASAHVVKETQAQAERSAKDLLATAGRIESRVDELVAKTIAAFSAATQQQSERAIEALSEAARSTSAAMAKNTAVLGEQLTAMAQKLGSGVAASVSQANAGLAANTEALGARLHANTEALAGSLNEATQRWAQVIEAPLAAQTASLQSLLSRFDALSQGLARILDDTRTLGEALRESSAAQAAASTAASQTAARSLAEVAAAQNAALALQTDSLGGASRELGASVRVLSPALSTLTAELGALGREVALLAARPADTEAATLTLAEIERLGATVTELKMLVTLASTSVVSDAPAAIESFSELPAADEITVAAVDEPVEESQPL